MSAKNETHPLWRASSGISLFEHLKSCESKAEVREYFENMHTRATSSMLLEKDFLRKFPHEVPQRWWELFVSNWLLSQPKVTSLGSHPAGPDFRFEHCNKICWLECTVPWPKADDRRIRIDSPTLRKSGTVRPEPYILAITSAVRDKIPQLKRAAKDSDICVVAINLCTGVDVDLAESEDPSLLFQAFLGIGPTAHEIPVINGEAILEEMSEVPTFRETISKDNGTQINVRGFLDGSLALISGILYSIHRYVDCPNPQTTDLLFLHNPTAANPLPRGSLAQVKEYVVEKDHLVLLSKPENAGGLND